MSYPINGEFIPLQLSLIPSITWLSFTERCQRPADHLFHWNYSTEKFECWFYSFHQSFKQFSPFSENGRPAIDFVSLRTALYWLDPVTSKRDQRVHCVSASRPLWQKICSRRIIKAFRSSALRLACVCLQTSHQSEANYRAAARPSPATCRRLVRVGSHQLVR